ncbi:MAG: hypothetical protein ISS82_05620 [Nanoarchaeota archaeon]|nr:hypothetical protein [Nanoarchaeota archaeon]
MDEKNSNSYKKSSEFEKRPKPFERKIIACPEDYYPLSKECRVIGAFNPGVAQLKTEKGLETILMIRVAESPSHKHPYWLPFFHIPNKLRPSKLEMGFDKYSKKEILEEYDKAVRLKENPHNRLKHISLPRLMRLNEQGEIIERKQEPCLYPSWEYERFGIEDVRITHMEDGRYALTYVCPHRDGVMTGLLITKNFQEFESVLKKSTPRATFIGKDVAIFSEKVSSPYETDIIRKNSKVYTALIRPAAYPDLSKPRIWVTYSPDLVHWGPPHRLTVPEKGEATGTGSSLIKINKRWVGPYHEISEIPKGLRYDTKLINLEEKDPWKNCRTSRILLRREDYLKFLPEKGYNPNVVYTTGITNNDGITAFFSGIDDTWTVMDKFYTEDLIKFLNDS